MEYHKGLGLWNRLEKICEEKGIKPFSLARKGVRKSTIDSIKRGSDIAVSAAYEVSKALGVTVEELLTGEEPQVKDAGVEYLPNLYAGRAGIRREAGQDNAYQDGRDSPGDKAEH